MIHDALITADELAQVTGYDQDAALKRALTQAGIVWFPGKHGRPWTTISLINQAGGIQAGAPAARKLGADDV
ncbi:DUF4224 domain-containing protein [Dyella sp.]|uniref:DUF4224 domain-containing protein n=1 Tax=Dyella sp. TaxID=1869338 RepID=UPI0039C86823